jgi:molecular chaperone DnaK
MADLLVEYLHKQGVKVVEAALRRVVGKAPSFLTDDVSFRQYVIQAAWQSLAPPIRGMMSRKFSLWEEVFLSLRHDVFDIRDGTIALRADAPARIGAFLQRAFRAECPRAAAATSPLPVAAPVKAAAPGSRNIPLASPVYPTGEPREQPKPRPSAPPSHPQGAGNQEPADTPVGIDLGTTYSVIAYLDAHGRPCSIPNAAGDLLTPSVVLFDENTTVVGKEAVLASALEPEKVAECVKRDMGAKIYRKKINGEHLPPEVISSLILRQLKADGERKLGPVRRAVITVPAYFDETRRRATMDAGRMAGLQVLDIINEPTAAAIAYGYQLGFLDRACQFRAERPLRVLVFDLGGGTFDVTIVELLPKAFKALATDGDVCLGGKDWDQKLIDLAAERFRQQFREDPRDNPVSLQELWLAAESAKRTLTERQKAAVFVNHLGSRLKVEVTRREFEDATAALLERTRMTAQIVVRQAGLTWDAIDRVLLVGGATRMPMVGAMLEQLAGKPPDRSVAVDEAVGHGAALYAGLLAPRRGAGSEHPPFTVTNVNSHSLGILGTDPHTGRKRNQILLPRNTPLPHTVTRTFKTFRPNQRSVSINVLEGESDRPEACTPVGVCAIRHLPPDLPAGWPVHVSYTYETNGRVHVTARLKGYAAGVTTDFLRENSLPDEELELWTRYVEEELKEDPVTR